MEATAGETDAVGDKMVAVDKKMYRIIIKENEWRYERIKSEE